MRRFARPREFLLNLNIDVILTICSSLLQESFLAFTNFFQVWVGYKSRDEILQLLHHLDWSNMHVHSMSWNQVTMDRFNAFLGECSRIRVSHALNYNACNNLFVNNQVNDNMYLLQVLARHDQFSFFAFNIFRAFFYNCVFEQSAEEMFFRFRNNKTFNDQFDCFLECLKGRLIISQAGWDAHLIMRPGFPMCEQFRSGEDDHYSPYSWPPTVDRVRKSNCQHCFLHMVFELIFN